LLGHLKHNYKPLKFRAPTELRVVAMFDSDWATDKNDRRSISSYLTTIGGTALVNWQSKKQQTIALSSCESETMAGTMCAQDVMFTMNLLQELVDDRLLKPSFVYGDNVASLFLAQNNAVSQRTKHIDIRQRFMYELVESKRFELRHVKTDENTSDINSKNTKIEIHKKMAERLYSGLAIAEIKADSSETNKRLSKSVRKSSKEDVELTHAISVRVIDDALPEETASEHGTIVRPQAINLAYPVKVPVSTRASHENKTASCSSVQAIVKRVHWKEGLLETELGSSSESITNSELITNRKQKTEKESFQRVGTIEVE
jgi:hypothetical protein